MKTVTANLERGSEWDSRVLLLAVLLVVAAFVSLGSVGARYGANDLFWPLLATGLLLVFGNIASRILRPKLRVSLLKHLGDQLEIHPVRNLQFSGWVAETPKLVPVSYIKNVNIYNFYTPASGAGMFWVGIEFNDRSVVQCSFVDGSVIDDIVSFFETALPDVPLHVEQGLKAS